MAEEEKKAEATDAASPSDTIDIKTVLIGVFVLVTLFVAAVMLVVTVIVPAIKPDVRAPHPGDVAQADSTQKVVKEIVEKKDAKEKAPLRFSFPMENLIGNLFGNEGRRYFKISMVMEIEPAGKDGVTLGQMEDVYQPLVLDALINMITNKRQDDLDEASDKDRLKLEIINAANNVIKGGRVTNIFFIEFLIQ